ncbi:MAG: DUF2442 domain-containing protein [Pseudomonadota bacterium]
MSTLAAKSLSFDEHTLWVELSDGRSLGVPLAWFPRLLAATQKQRQDYFISVSGLGLHWDDLDEDISVPALLAGHGDRSREQKSAA